MLFAAGNRRATEWQYRSRGEIRGPARLRSNVVERPAGVERPDANVSAVLTSGQWVPVAAVERESRALRRDRDDLGPSPRGLGEPGPVCRDAGRRRLLTPNH